MVGAGGRGWGKESRAGGGSDRGAVGAVMGLLAWAVPKAHNDRRWPVRDVVRGSGKGAGAGGQAFWGVEGWWHH